MSILTKLNPKNILVIGAHPDDIEIGCGGTLLSFLRDSANGFKDVDCRIQWIVFSGNETRRNEAINSAKSYSEKVEVSVLDFQDSFFPNQWSEIKKAIHKIASNYEPDLVFTHRMEDRHQDHKVLSELTWNAFRNQVILEYEIPKYEGDLAKNNFFSSIDPQICAEKIDLLMESFPSQSTKPWFDRELFQGIMRVRGIEAPSDSKYAEAFYCRKMAFQL